jgi:hypothetical protein
MSDIRTGFLPGPAAVTTATSPCLNRPAGQITVLSGSTTAAYTVNDPGSDGRTFDARNWTSNAYGQGGVLYPFNIGSGTNRRDVCVVGGTVNGVQPRTATWATMKRNYDGDGLRIEGTGTLGVHGIRIDNIEDGISPHGPGDVDISGCHLSYIRDDAFENDDHLDGTITDCLVDGCYIPFSERSNHSVSAAGRMTIDGVLVRMEAMPYDLDVTGDPPAAGSVIAGKGHGQPWKWEAEAHKGTNLVVRNTIIVIPQLSVNGAGSMDWPSGTYTNVTLIWLGGGNYPGTLPVSGVTVSTNLNIWTQAKNAWLASH